MSDSPRGAAAETDPAFALQALDPQVADFLAWARGLGLTEDTLRPPNSVPELTDEQRAAAAAAAAEAEQEGLFITDEELELD